MKSKEVRNHELWLLKNMDRGEKWRCLVVYVAGLFVLILSCLQHDGAGHILTAAGLLLIIGAYSNSIVSILKRQERRLHALESERASDPEKP